MVQCAQSTRTTATPEQWPWPPKGGSMRLRLRFSLVSIAATALVVPLAIATPAQAAPMQPTTAVQQQQTDEVWEASEQQREHVPSEAVSTQAWTPPGLPYADASRRMSVQDAAAPKINAPGRGVLPFYTYQDFQVSDRAVIRVNVANGSMFFAATPPAEAAAKPIRERQMV